MDTKEIAKEWFTLANFDLKSAVFLLDMRPKPLEIIAYHCQQSAEKYLKGFIAFHGGDIRKTHDLVVLNSECQKYESSLEEILNECVNLTDYGVHVRYPYHIDIEEQDVKIAIEDAQKVKLFVQGLTNITTE